MITTDLMPERVEMRAYGTMTLADCKAFEAASNYRVQFNGPIDLLFDLRSMTGYSLDVALEEWRYVRANPTSFRKVALLTDDQFVTWGAWLSQFFTEADIRIFETERAARHWLDGDSQLEDDSILH
ncbi:hypothetical protein GCM10027046_14170 [Uliginosibacterium flavum]|uniref:STAS/SEC14 domain-containing protein n=1 Tax=Uliginosibacterium flavum TaxID=1396831 RepID=A0ABV2TQK4_9RHOO